MKRIAVCAMALALVASMLISALAEAPEPFVFREGVTFGMSPDEVIACEGSEPTARRMMSTELPWEAVMWADAQVSEYTADLAYLFWDNRLMMAAYDFSDEETAARDNLAESLDMLYGESREPDPDEILAVMNSFAPDWYSRDSFPYRRAWEIPDGTRVFLMQSVEYGFSILYVSDDFNPDEINAADTVHDTTGR